MIFHDPVQWGLEMQILSDVLVDSRTHKQRIPLLVTNNDLLYNTEFPVPRFTQGAFVEAFKALFHAMHGRGLEIEYFGKPFAAQYAYAEEALHMEASRLALPLPDAYFGIGDNPKSDIRGANNAGERWRSVLVRTGIFSDASSANDVEDPADYVCDNVEDAVDLIIAS